MSLELKLLADHFWKLFACVALGLAWYGLHEIKVDPRFTVSVHFTDHTSEQKELLDSLK